MEERVRKTFFEANPYEKPEMKEIVVCELIDAWNNTDDIANKFAKLLEIKQIEEDSLIGFEEKNSILSSASTN